MQNEYVIRLRKAAYFVCIALVLTWGLVIYLMWLTDRQEQYINTLESDLNSSSSTTSEEESNPQSSSEQLVWI